MDRQATAVYNRAIKRALDKVFNLDMTRDGEMIDLLFPIWRQAIHQILLRKGCGCTSGEHANCFLHLSETEQIQLLPPDNVYSFFYFVNVITKGRVNFYNQIFSNACPVLNA